MWPLLSTCSLTLGRVPDKPLMPGKSVTSRKEAETSGLNQGPGEKQGKGVPGRGNRSDKGMVPLERQLVFQRRWGGGVGLEGGSRRGKPGSGRRRRGEEQGAGGERRRSEDEWEGRGSKREELLSADADRLGKVDAYAQLPFFGRPACLACKNPRLEGQAWPPRAF